VDELLSVIRDGGQSKYLVFWGHQPMSEDGVGKGCLSQWWPAAFTVDGVVAGLPCQHRQPGPRRGFPQDRVWGIGLAADDERTASPARWLGLDLLGFALMEVRQQLRPSRVMLTLLPGACRRRHHRAGCRNGLPLSHCRESSWRENGDRHVWHCRLWSKKRVIR
jgi:hypothetical protein